MSDKKEDGGAGLAGKFALNNSNVDVNEFMEDRPGKLQPMNVSLIPQNEVINSRQQPVM